MALRTAIPLLLALTCAACAGLAGDDTKAPAQRPATAASTPPPTAAPPRTAPPKEPAAKEPAAAPADSAPGKGAQLLAQGVKSYEDGDYRSASIQFQAALHEALAGTEQASAHKHLAFIACASKRAAMCSDEFRKALAADPAFDLTPAEAGHPTWGPAFKRVKAEMSAKAKGKRTP